MGFPRLVQLWHSSLKFRKRSGGRSRSAISFEISFSLHAYVQFSHTLVRLDNLVVSLILSFITAIRYHEAVFEHCHSSHNIVNLHPMCTHI